MIKSLKVGIRASLAILSVTTLLAQAPYRSVHPALQETVSVASLRVPAKAREHYEKAKAAVRNHRDDLYEREIQKALEIYPDFAEAYLLIADRENASGRYDAAAEDALKAQKLDPFADSTLLVLAAAYNGQQRYQDALVILSNVRGLDATAWQAKYERARAEVGRGNAESAMHWSELALESAPPSFVEAHLLRADALLLAHRWREAGAELELYLASTPPTVRRASIQAVLERTRLRAEEQERNEVAAR